MSTKTASVRLESNLYTRIDEHCVSKGCSRNDFIKNSIETALNNYKKDDVVDHKSHYDSFGNWWYWNHDGKIWTCQINMKTVRVSN